MLALLVLLAESLHLTARNVLTLNPIDTTRNLSDLLLISGDHCSRCTLTTFLETSRRKLFLTRCVLRTVSPTSRKLAFVLNLLLF